ncbi:MAG: glycoside hydrolase family 97 catalytic domain-containing protein, partial [Clostridia bacterium]|nr:glycoside hydrolase family 97 catalytic domain-containing protein [Clostridia bacterium]
MNTCIYSLNGDTLTLSNDVFSYTVNGVENVISSQQCDSEGLSAPYTEISAIKNGNTVKYRLWDGLPVVYTPEHKGGELLTIEGLHWIVKSVKLHAFTDDNDTLVTEQEQHLYHRKLFHPCKGEIFILEDPLTEKTILIVSETPDYQTATLSINRGAVTVENGGNGLAVGFCKLGEAEALCREYYRHARLCKGLFAMSNTWGDRNGFSRVCHDFVIKEIDAAERLGVDIVQIDDGWQTGSTADLTLRDELGRRFFPDSFWELNRDRFHDMRSLTRYASSKGIKVGMWFAPDSHNNFALLERDVSVLKKAYDEWGIRFFKLDMFWITSDIEKEQFMKLLAKIYSFGNDVAVQLDVTRNERPNYLCAKQYGTVFVENRYTKTVTVYPHRTLRNLWMLAKYVPASKFQFELINPDLNSELYPDGDPFAPINHDMDYLFATVMLSNPLFWMEMQFLSNDRRKQLDKIMPVWKECRNAIAECDVLPIGDKPNGRAFCGFYLSRNGRPEYLLLFRQLTAKA